MFVLGNNEKNSCLKDQCTSVDVLSISTVHFFGNILTYRTELSDVLGVI